MSSLKEKAKNLPQVTLDGAELKPEFVINVKVGKFKVKQIIVGLASLEFKPEDPTDKPKIELTLTNIE